MRILCILLYTGLISTSDFNMSHPVVCNNTVLFYYHLKTQHVYSTTWQKFVINS